jgi:hypothetical protein
MTTRAKRDRKKANHYYRHTVPLAAQSIAEEMIQAARTSGDDAVVFVTSNSYLPPLRSFPEAEAVWQSPHNDDGEVFAGLAEMVEARLTEANVLMECPEYDNALYVVDLNRFAYVEDAGEDAENLSDEWRPVDATPDDDPSFPAGDVAAIENYIVKTFEVTNRTARKAIDTALEAGSYNGRKFTIARDGESVNVSPR